MRYGRQPKWYSGQFLDPQQLQYLTLHAEECLSNSLKINPIEYWGIQNVEFDNSFLQSKTLKINSLTAVTEAGTVLEFPGNCTVPDFSFGEQWLDPSIPIDIYFGVHQANPATPNVGAGDYHNRSTNSPPMEMLDYNDAENSSKVELIELQLRLFTGANIKDAGDYELIHCARLISEDGVVSHDPNFSYPTTNLVSAPVLRACTREMYEKIVEAAKRLEEVKDTFNGGTLEFGGRQARLLAGFQVLASYIGRMGHILELPCYHPANAYEAISQLVSQLSVFSQNVDLHGSYRGGNIDDLVFKHRDPARAYLKVLGMIEILLDELLPSPRLVIPFVNVTNERLFVEIPEYFFTSNTDYFLMLEVTTDDANWLEQFQSKTKISSREELDALIQHSLVGLDTQLAPSRPSGAPVRDKALFFRLDSTSNHWKHIVRDKNIAIDWKAKPEHAFVELVAVQR